MIYVMTGGGKLFAAIGVTYPAGSTCTCTKGSKTLRAGDTSGRCVFSVPEAGTWTVTCTSGTNTATKTVGITVKGQVASVTLAYWNGELYQNGNQYTTVTGGWTGATTVGSNYLELNHSNTSYSYMQCTNKIDVTNYTKATLTVKNASAWCTIRLNVGAAMKEVQAEGAAANDVTVELDISGISGDVTVQVGSKCAGGSFTGNFRMYSLILS